MDRKGRNKNKAAEENLLESQLAAATGETQTAVVEPVPTEVPPDTTEVLPPPSSGEAKRSKTMYFAAGLLTDEDFLDAYGKAVELKKPIGWVQSELGRLWDYRTARLADKSEEEAQAILAKSQTQIPLSVFQVRRDTLQDRFQQAGAKNGDGSPFTFPPLVRGAYKRSARNDEALLGKAASLFGAKK